MNASLTMFRLPGPEKLPEVLLFLNNSTKSPLLLNRAVSSAPFITHNFKGLAVNLAFRVCLGIRTATSCWHQYEALCRLIPGAINPPALNASFVLLYFSRVFSSEVLYKLFCLPANSDICYKTSIAR